MSLPGGIVVDGVLKRDYHFKPVTGLMELELCESAQRVANQPAQVSWVLHKVLASLADQPVTLEGVQQLSVGDRQYLMQRLAVHIDDSLIWMTARCGSCNESFDLPLRYAELPVKPAGKGFPEQVIDSSQGMLKVRVPTGLDQELIAGFGDEAAMTMLLERLVARVDDKTVDVTALNQQERDEIESVVEAMAPEVATELLTGCPQCGAENRVAVNPYASMAYPRGKLFAEVHTLAVNYHWSEHEILALPRSRRQIYLGMIDRGRDMHSDLNNLKLE